MDYLKAVKKGKKRQGRKHLIGHLEGKQLTPRQAIHAKCYDCTGFYDDGARDCASTTCPLWQYMPYNPNRVKRVKQAPEGAEELEEELEEEEEEELEEEEDFEYE